MRSLPERGARLDGFHPADQPERRSRPRADATVSAMGASPLRRLVRHARAHRGRVRLGLTFSVLNKVFDLAPPLLIGAAVGIVVDSERSFLDTRFGITDRSDQLYALAADSGRHLGPGEPLRVPPEDRLAQPRPVGPARPQARGLPPRAGPRDGLLRGRGHRRADERPQRRRQPARALPRRGRQQPRPAGDDDPRGRRPVLLALTRGRVGRVPADALHRLGLDRVPEEAPGPLPRRARARGRAERGPLGEPRRDRHDQELRA